MLASDVAQVLDLWARAGLPVRPSGRDSAEQIVRQLGLHPTTYLVAEQDGELIGVVLGTHDGRKGWINRLAVLPGRRRQGVARQLVASCEAALARSGIGIVGALVEHGNEASARFFGALAYRQDVPVLYFRKLDRPDA